MLTNLLPTKLLIPQTRPELVARTRLIHQLDQGMYRTLTLVSAPAGFGKTTLVAEWVDRFHTEKQRNSEICVAWFSIDEADNDFNRFLTYFISALIQSECVDDESGKVILDMLQSPNPPPIDSILSPLIIALSSTDKKITILLDDYHLIEDLQIHKTLNFWLENVPPNVHTVVITREDPPFPLARFRARDQLTEIRAADLRFTDLEATYFLNDIMGLRLKAKTVALLGERTEGWIAGLQMAALSMQDREDVESFVNNFAGTHRFILDYLLEEVLANQPPAIQEFLLRTSIFRRISAPLCDAVLGVENGASSTIDYLEKANLFLIPLDNDRQWYRYHHLFTDLLSARLQQTHSKDEVAELHTHAAQWYEENGMAFEAIYHASLIPNDEWVERIIDQNYMEVFQRRDSASIRNWTGELGKELIFKRPQLAIHEANSRAWFGQLDEADHLLLETEKRLGEAESTPEIKAMYGYLSYVKGRVIAMRGDFFQAIQLCMIAQENTPDSNQGLLGGIGVMLGYGYFLNGEFSLAAQTLQQTIQSGKKSGAINTTIGAYCVLARLYAIQGQLQKAFNLYQEAENVIRQSEGEHRGAMSIVDVGYAEILYEWNKLEAALIHIQQGLEFLPLWSKADDFSLAYIIQAQIQIALGDLQAAGENISKGSQIIRSSGVFSEARDTVAAAEILLGLAQENSHAINRWINTLESRLNSEHPYRFENELVLIALARVYIVQKKYTESKDLLAHLEASAKASGRGGRLLKIQILRALLMFEMGTYSQAYSILELALTIAETERYERVFIDEGRPMQGLLTHWISHAEEHPARSYASHLISQFSTQSLPAQHSQGSSTSQAILIERLTQREIEVLALIALGKTNKEISTELIVSPGTIKAHTSNIYRKLDVSNRTEAVSRARDLGILS